MPLCLRAALLPLCLALAACGAPRDRAESTARPADAGLPSVMSRSFGPATPVPARRSNAAMMRDFMALTFSMESGRPVPVLSRFEGPVTVGVAGKVPPTAAADLDRLLARLRAEAGIDISRAGGPAPDIVVEFLPRKTMRAIVPQAACFVAPGVSSWSEYRRARRSDRVDWTLLSTRRQAAVFIPSDTAPQEVRDCLHEEIAQALGPLNDLYELPDSVFNDDNIHGMLTGFDMLTLRAYYAPELQSGMRPEAVAAALPAIYARLNPAGGSAGWHAQQTPRPFISALETTLSPRSSDGERRAAAARATSIADGQGWTDVRAGFAWFLRGRIALGTDPATALDALLRAEAIYRTSALSELHAAHLDMHLAAFALSQGQADEALRRASRATGPAMAAQNAALLSTLLMVTSEALELQGRTGEAEAARREAVAWARYGFGSEAETRRRLGEIAALSPLRRTPSE